MPGKYLRTDDTTKRIVQVKFVRDTDTDPDLSFLGEYASRPGPAAQTIDREERGDRGGHEYRYFVATMSEKETGNPASVEVDYQRMEAYNRQGWCMTFCQAVARVSILGVEQTITSGGLGGVESDSDASYFAEIATDEVADLSSILSNVGFTAEQIDAAVQAI